MIKENLWKAILGELKISASYADIKTFFPLVDVEDYKNNVLTLSCQSPIVKERIENRYHNQIKNIAEKITKESVGVAVIVKPAIRKPEDIAGPLFAAETKPKVIIQNDTLSPKYTFENFVVGSNNRLAHTVALSVAENPGKSYNPFFLYAGVGLGKTHLIQAVGNKILQEHPDLKVLYCTGESFGNELLEALRLGRPQRTLISKFKEKFRGVDVLLVDDVQFIAGKESTQEEFFHGFNTLYMAGKQIVLTSDKPPSEIQKLERRLSSRFSSGMIADMQMPDTDMRSAILRNKRDALKVKMPNEVCDFIAQNAETNIRELEGIFTQVVAKVQADNTNFSLDNVSIIMGRSLKKTAINAPDILKATATYYNIKVSDLKGERRTKEIVFPRQVAMYLTKKLTGFSLMDIGDLLGGRDHSTVLHSIRKIEGNANTKINQDIANIKASLGIY